MIKETLTCIEAILNARQDAAKYPAIVSGLDFSCTDKDNHLVISLINIEEDSALRNIALTNNFEQPIQHLNLFVLITAHFIASNYVESLGCISRIISFFHKNPVFTSRHSNFPTQSIEKFTVEFCSIDLNKMAMLWQSIGNPYLPSAVFKLQLHYLPNEGTC